MPGFPFFGGGDAISRSDVNRLIESNLAVTAALRTVLSTLQTLSTIVKGNTDAMSKFDDDMTELKSVVTANTDAFNKLAAIKGQEEALIKDQAQQIADLKAANPALDLAGLEENILQLKDTNSRAQQILPAPAAG